MESRISPSNALRSNAKKYLTVVNLRTSKALGG